MMYKINAGHVVPGSISNLHATWVKTKDPEMLLKARVEAVKDMGMGRGSLSPQVFNPAAAGS